MQNITFGSKENEELREIAKDREKFVEEGNDPNDGGHIDIHNENLRLCKFWVNTGNCLKEQSCDFAHPEDKKGSPPEFIRDRVCKFWTETGFCAKADACDFSHDGKPGSKPNIRVCRFYAERGFCAKGDYCDFSHDVTNNILNNKVCRFWLRGDCIKGMGCDFKHESGKRQLERFDEPWSEREPWGGPDQMPSRFDKRDPMGSMSIQSENDSRRRDGAICKSFENGRCSYGRSCAFVHVDPNKDGDELDLESRRDSKRKLESGYGAPEKRMKIDDLVKPRVRNLGDIAAKDPKKEESLDKALRRIDLKVCLQFAMHACIKCGQRIIEKKDDPDRGKDIEDFEEDCSNILAGPIANKYPLHIIIGKQNADSLSALSESPTWFISPINGMDNFLRGSPLVCVSIALCVQRRPVLGVVYNPSMGHLYAAHRGGGTFFNSSEETSSLVMKPFRFKNCREARGAIVVNEFKGGNVRNKLADIGVRFRETGSLNYNFLDVLRRVCDGGYQEGFDGPWSVCAGVTLIEEAGGVATDFDGNIFELNMKKPELVYGPRSLVEDMLRSI